MNKKNIMKKISKIIFLFIISFFICGNTFADTVKLPEIKKYDEIDVDALVDNNHSFWGDDEGDAPRSYVKAQRKFYKKLYRVLSKYQKRKLYVDDRVIVETIFFQVSPGEGVAGYDEYQNTWEAEGSSTTAIINDDIEGDTVGINDEDENELAADYDEDNDDNNKSVTEENFKDFESFYKKEKDTVKLLVKNAIAIRASCYSLYDDPVTETDADGNRVQYCLDENGNRNDDIKVTKISPLKTTCAKEEESASGYHSHYEYYLTKLAIFIDKNPFLSAINGDQFNILGLTYEPKEYNACKQLAADTGRATRFTYYGHDFEVSYNKYWSFLVENAYFDGKYQFQSYFNDVFDEVLKNEKIDVECMKKELCELSLDKHDGLYKKYDSKIKEAREQIVFYIMNILENNIEPDYTEEELDVILDYGGYRTKLVDAINDEVIRKSYYWPIGSDETEERDGILYADGEPASTNVIREYGENANPVTGEIEKHNGMDIEGVDGVTNVIAVYGGRVTSVVTNCDASDKTCNNGYGNMVIIEHSNGDYAVFGHLSTIMDNIQVGATVKRGQVLGKVGQTGATNTPCLHYEIRKNGASPDDAVDPSTYHDPNNLRPTMIQGSASQSGVCLALKQMGYGDDAIAAIMVNMGSESGFVSSNVQNAPSGDDPQWDLEYTAKVSSGEISEEDFVYHGPNGGGYGLIQWTSHGRKKALYDAWKLSGADSIADMGVQLNVLQQELNSRSTGSVLADPSKSVEYKTWHFCYYFEAPEARETSCGNKANPSNSTSGRAASGPSMLAYVQNGCQ